MQPQAGAARPDLISRLAQPHELCEVGKAEPDGVARPASVLSLPWSAGKMRATLP